MSKKYSGGCDHVHTHSDNDPIDNHTCHCSVCKRVTGQDSTHVVFFNYGDLEVDNPQELKRQPFNSENPDGPLELCVCETCGTPIMLDDKQRRIRVIVPNLMGYDPESLPATYHAFYDPAAGAPAPDDGRPVYDALRPDFAWPAPAQISTASGPGEALHALRNPPMQGRGPASMDQNVRDVRINSDFSQRVVIRPADYRWVDSPMPGVERMMLDRIGGEVARATSLVRYAPNSTFPPHVHGGGEEFFVLEGEFGDEHRTYPAGTYVRNPIGTQHSPRVGEQGCIIFVKLHQFDPGDDTPVVVDTRNQGWPLEFAPGFAALRLHGFRDEHVFLIRWAPNTPFEEHTHHGGEEVFVIEGSFSDEHGDYPAGSWVRYPDGSRHNAFTRDEGALLYLKAGHLRAAP